MPHKKYMSRKIQVNLQKLCYAPLMKIIGLSFTDEDLQLLEQLQELLKPRLGIGKVTRIAAIRWALRQVMGKAA